MLRQVSLAVEAPDSLREVAKKHDAQISVLDCKDFNAKGMTMLIEVSAPRGKIKDVITDLKRGSFKKLYAASTGSSRSVCVGVLDRPLYCQAVLDSGVLCMTCPYNGSGKESMWKILVKDSGALKGLIGELEKRGVSVKIADVSNAGQDEELTPRQREILSKAISLGYYEFPRRIDLTTLGREVGVKPSTLSEILRNAERKIMSETGRKLGIRNVSIPSATSEPL